MNEPGQDQNRRKPKRCEPQPPYYTVFRSWLLHLRLYAAFRPVPVRCACDESSERQDDWVLPDHQTPDPAFERQHSVQYSRRESVGIMTEFLPIYCVYSLILNIVNLLVDY